MEKNFNRQLFKNIFVSSNGGIQDEKEIQVAPASFIQFLFAISHSD